MTSARLQETRSPYNDAHLIQLVRCALGKVKHTRDTPRINVSSCKFIVTLHGAVRSPEQRALVEAAVCEVRGVRGVVNKLAVR